LHEADHYPVQLSGGEQRVSFLARAFPTNQQFFLLMNLPGIDRGE
jgi:predicted ABC-type transport system involved in lysophospholipase L1 biosynthesis ATPase subunit